MQGWILKVSGFHFIEVGGILLPGLVEIDLLESVHELGNDQVFFMLAMGCVYLLHNDIINNKIDKED